jgi:hypothetical protein
VAGVVVDDLHPVAGQSQVTRHVAAPLAVGERRLARGRVEQPELRAELARPARQPASRRLQAHAVIAAHVGLVAHHPVHPVVGGNPGSGQHHAVDIARGDAEVAQQRIHGATRIARVVLEAREPLLRRAADNLAVAQDGRGRAVSLADAQDDHDLKIISAMVTSF